ncbi:helix-turn-helix domain-containing protein [Melghirimyces algeriensis]|uniref:DNA-binding transcriptional regulator, XRE family n=1 Tax=Melghirimyces algeriensis TaxID=910412 RepID=A0A521F7S8_9BACL|nr:helix-turn-helix domain-containing protein [Melghirimyces algeriensis]SMO92239.1 DNA-binding transcriptional regulator, XRE family [Melghirimyces algeriensis]
MISYDPLFVTLEEKNVKLIDLITDLKFSKTTGSKFRKHASVQLTTIEKICKYLDCPIEKVVRIE